KGQPLTQATSDSNPTLNHQIATPGYFETLRIPLRGGRSFTADDTTARPRVAILSESTARRLWPGQNAVGKRLTMYSFNRSGPRLVERTVVGVVADVRYHALGEVQFDIYDPAMQIERGIDNVVVRTSGDVRGTAASVRAIARALDAGAIVDEV